ncbi:DUF1294 domain-containing protein [Salipaludibacillus sp. LMS25]|jgi:uncharacterized membrane protein YsdA (DUF1294 family)|uniref:DUF1294 domain-containing protein n=1 Tax=Salipaludibacillus sp. LMS25 TaxID=2924031 RepID=UPI0020D13C00|nr:DUF1294 domain-containing protein [Salipaludibacillus sp. LMS25]UTR15561.1 DUF1294 domain-containing protein [Salipaludibacillus sp. LMS25]
MQILELSVLGWLLVINLIGIILMNVDKRRAQRREWRISEGTLFFIAVLGGAVGMWGASQVIRHKTKKSRFYIGFPLIAVIQVALLVYFSM